MSIHTVLFNKASSPWLGKHIRWFFVKERDSVNDDLIDIERISATIETIICVKLKLKAHKCQVYLNIPT